MAVPSPRRCEICERPERFVYFVRSGPGGPIKIGVTARVAARIRQLQTGSAVRLHLAGIIGGACHFHDERSGLSQERLIHFGLAKHRLSDEWFSPHQDVLDLISEIA